jgi:Xaa-Pro dipeptidase
MSKTRAERLISNCGDMDAVVISNDGEPFLDSTFWYLTEQSSGCFEGTFAIVTKEGDLHVITGSLEEETAKSGLGEVHIYKTREDRDAIIKTILEGSSKIGFNFHSTTYAAVEYVKRMVGDVEIADAGRGISSTTAIKDSKEIEATRKACGISSKVAEEIPDMLREGMTEKEMGAMMDNRMRELGGTGNAFDTIAAFGENASQPHYMPGDRKLGKGDVALFDFGTKYDRYCSDMTRTVFFGEPPEILRRAYEVVQNAQQAGFEQYRDGAKASEADAVARKIIDDSEFAGRFIHTFGHGIGMEVHQDISVYSKSEQILHAGNIVSAEPGIYLPGIGGIRIEDTCLITKGGAERLTSFDHDITIV